MFLKQPNGRANFVKISREMKLQIKLWFALGCLYALSPGLAHGQGWIHVFRQHDSLYGGNAIYITPGNDGGFWYAGTEGEVNGNSRVYLQHITPYGLPDGHAELAPSTFFADHTGLVQPASGGFALLLNDLTGNIADTVQLLRTAPVGTVEWRRFLATEGQNRASDLVLLPDQGFLVSAVFNDTITFIRLDSAGQELWRLHDSHPQLTHAYSAQPLLSLDHEQFYQPFRLDTLPGNPGILFTKSYRINIGGWFEPAGPSFWDTLMARHVFSQPDGGLLAISSALQGDFTVRSVTPTGTELWEKTIYIDPGWVSFSSAVFGPAASGGGFVMADSDYEFSDMLTHLLVARFDSQAQVIWQVDLNLTALLEPFEDVKISAVRQIATGGYLLAGTFTDLLFQSKPLVLYIDSLGRVQPATVAGELRFDENADCLAQAAEDGLEGWKIHRRDTVTGLESYDATGAAGQFAFQSDTMRDYRIELILPNPYWQACESDTLVSVATPGDTALVSFLVQPVVECPFLEVSIGAPLVRLCYPSVYRVRYCNTGTVAASDAFVRITLDPAMVYTGASFPGLPEGDHTWRFDLGSVDAGDCGSFELAVTLDCNSAVLGQTHCVEAHIFPDSLCVQQQNWSGAQVDVNGACHPDSVRFVIRNTGLAPTSPLNYIVIEDNIIYYQDLVQLPANDSFEIVLPANGSTWRVEVDQEPGAPANPMPSAVVEGCGLNENGTFSIGFVSQFGEDDADPFISVDCQANVGSFDPNDKQGFPLGYGPEHFIEPGQPLEYLIRFQNTGTDTAFKIVVLDTLAAWLDPATVQPGAASHAYTFDLRGPGIVEFRFENVLLPDSNINEPASHGFLKFRVQPRIDAPLGAVVYNRAAIYFDFNEPVLTNETWHTLGQDFVPVGTKAPSRTASLQVWPNPARAGGELNLSRLPSGSQAATLAIYDVLGRRLTQLALNGNRVRLPARLNSGLYVFRLEKAGRVLGSGRVIVQE
jgi:uncharacterized repeat protein (TIGR01451 family)